MFFQDVTVGFHDELGAFTFTAPDIKHFAARFDPQPFHMDEAAAERSHFGGLLASGWQVAAVWMRLMVAYRERKVAEAEGRSEAFGRLGPSPGFRNLVWALPVRGGDTLTYRWEITAKKESASRPDWGLVSMRNWALNQDGGEAFRFDGLVFWERYPRASGG